MKKVTNNYHGFLALPRHTKLLIKDLGESLFVFYLRLAMEAVWHRNNHEIGCVTKSQAALASIIGCDQSTVSRNLKELEVRQYLIRRDDQIWMSYFPLFLADVARAIHSKDYANVHELYADIHKVDADLQASYAQAHIVPGEDSPQSFSIPYKGDLGSSHSYSGNSDVDIDEISEGIERQRNGGGT
jgi:DNA-binding MarR family transcriptional regulator